MYRKFMAVAIAVGAVGAAVLGAAPAQAEPSTDIVINEVASRGSNGADDEFIELTNKSASTVDIDGWLVELYDSNNALRQTVPIPTTAPLLAPGDFYVIANSAGYDDAFKPQQFYAPVDPGGLPDRGGVRLLRADNSTVDGFATDAGATTPLEGSSPASPQTVNVDESNQRVPNATDTDNNQVDFQIRPRTVGAANPLV